MTQTYFPFDAGAGAAITESQWRDMARHWLATGVIRAEDNELQVYGDSTGQQVKVKTGKAFLRGHYYANDAEVILTIATANATNPRIDRVVLKGDFTANTIAVEVITGTPAATPAAPGFTNTTSTWRITLAQVYVAAGSASVDAGDVTDERTNFVRNSLQSGPSLPGAGFMGDLFQVGTTLYYWSGSAWVALATTTLAQTLTAKTITSPVLTLETGTPTPAGRLSYSGGFLRLGNGSVSKVSVDEDSAETLTNKTLGAGTVHSVAPTWTPTTMIVNMNADMVDGSHAAAFAIAAHTHDATTIDDQSIGSRELSLTVPTTDVVTQQTTTSTSYTDLATVGPAVTVSPGVTQEHLIMISAGVSSSTGAGAQASVAVAGGTPSVDDALSTQSTVLVRSTRVRLAAAQTNGATHTMKYLASSGTATFEGRRIVALAL